MIPPRSPLAGRYRFEAPIQADGSTSSWLAQDDVAPRTVVVSTLSADQVAGLVGIIGLKDPSLAALLDLVTEFDPDVLPPEGPANVAGIGVAEHISGTTLEQSLKSGPLMPYQAVGCFLSIAKALRSVHALGGVHGEISPAAIILEARDGRQGSVLTQLATPAPRAFYPPDRLQGRPPSASGDVWQLYACLYTALGGVAPFTAEDPEQLLEEVSAGRFKPLADLGVRDASLAELVTIGLSGNLAERQTDIGDLVRALEDWLKFRAASAKTSRPNFGFGKATSLRSKAQVTSPPRPSPREQPEADEEATMLLRREDVVSKFSGDAVAAAAAAAAEEDDEDATMVLRDRASEALLAAGIDVRALTRAADGSGEEDATLVLRRDDLTRGIEEHRDERADGPRPASGPLSARPQAPERRVSAAAESRPPRLRPRWGRRLALLALAAGVAAAVWLLRQPLGLSAPAQSPSVAPAAAAQP